MTSTRCTRLPPAADEGPSLGHSSDPGPAFVGRASAPASGRALVPTTPSRLSEAGVASKRLSATFLAQLIAAAQQVAQTRARRHAEPGDASAVYTAAVARCIDVGGTVCRSMWA